ncbi:MAG TPA: hypothetical protein DEB06_02435 [Phycisphaerales bacterium]|nr:hypothetical protein [Phycisphaerales bacterium]
MLLAATTAACLLAGVLATRHHWRKDVTASRRHTLSPRTQRVLGTVAGPHTIIVSADRSRLGRPVTERVADLLSEFTKARPSVRVAWIDTGSSGGGGRASFASLLAELAAAESEEHRAQREALSAAASAVPGIQAGLNAIAQSVAEAGRSLASQQEAMERQAGLLRAVAARLDGAMVVLAESASAAVAGVELPAIDRAQRDAQPALSEAARAAGAVADFALRTATTPGGADPDALRALADRAGAVRDAAAIGADTISRLRPTDALIVARTLEAADAVLVTGPKGTVAIDFGAMFPASDAAPGAPGDALFAGEQLVATALGALNSPASPIVVFVHAELATLLEPSVGGAPTQVARQGFGQLMDRLRLMRFDLAEWPVARSESRPDLSSINPRGDRPVVWVVFGAPSRAALDPKQPALLTDHTERVDRLARAVGSLIESGDNFLLSIEPSDRPAIGDADPVSAPLLALGVRAESARPLLRRESSPSGPLIHTALTLRGGGEAAGDSALGAAVEGLAFALSWTSPLVIDAPPEGVRVSPVLRTSGARDTWGESQWFLLRALEARARRHPFDPLALADPPAPEPTSDLTEPPAGGWTVAATVERTLLGRPQRGVIVGSPAWFDDLRAGASQQIDARRVRLYPGNAELFDGSLFWLAGLDDLVAPGPQVRDTPRIGPMNPAALTTVRWLLIAGLPVGVLLTGLLLRIIRG